MTTPTHTATPRRARRGATRAAAVAAGLVLLAAGCGDDGDDASTGGSGDGPGLRVAAPADGDSVTVPFDLTVETDEELGEPDTGRHHLHVYYDGDTDEGDYDLVYEDSFTVERDLEPGEHTVEVVLAQADHSLTDQRDEVTVTIGEGAGAGGEAPGGTGGTEDTDGGYGY